MVSIHSHTNINICFVESATVISFTVEAEPKPSFAKSEAEYLPISSCVTETNKNFNWNN